MRKGCYLKVLFNVLIFITLSSLSLTKVFSQEVNNYTKNNFSIDKLQLEARFDFDYLHNLDDNINNYGFGGKYLNFILDGKFNDKLSYSYRQRILPNKGGKIFFDGTDWIYLSVHFNNNFTLSTGKLPVAIGGFEYDAPPIDVYYWSNFWENIFCYELGAQFSFTDDKKQNTLTLQLVNSPYSGVRYDEETNSFNQVGSSIDKKFCYSLIWYGNYKHIQTIYSVNMLQNHNNKFVNYISLGTKFLYNNFKIYIDVMNRAANFDNFFFKNYTIISRLDYRILDNFNIFVKGGLDRNNTEETILPINYSDIFVLPGTNYNFIGFGTEYFALNEKIRVHSYLAYNNSNNKNNLVYSLGLTWRMNFAQLINKK